MNFHVMGAFVALVVAAEPPQKYGTHFEELPGLTLRGTGCHRDLLARDGSRVCSAVVKSVPNCYPALIVRQETDGGTMGQRVLLGATCAPPRLNTGAMGAGRFFVDGEDGGVVALCDDADGRDVTRKEIRDCCRVEKSIRYTSICRAR